MKLNGHRKLLTLTVGILAFIAIFTFGLLMAIFISSSNISLPSKISLQKLPKAYIVLSGSMEPAIKLGSVVISAPADNYVQGDIITFSPNGDNKNLVTHRIEFKKYPNGIDKEPVYMTAGDANKTFDLLEIKNENIVGKVIVSVPYLGYFADFAKKPQGFILLVIVPATIVIYEELRVVGAEFSKLLSKLKSRLKKKSISEVNLVPLKRKGINKGFVLIPVFGSLFVLLAFSLAYFFDIETSLGNILGAATSFGEKTAPLYDSNDATCEAGATNLSNPQPKVVILKKEGGNIKATVVLDGATPSSSYDIWINQDPGGCPLSGPTETGAVSTDVNGDGTGDAEATLVEGTTNFWISAVGGGQVLRSTAVSF